MTDETEPPDIGPWLTAAAGSLLVNNCPEGRLTRSYVVRRDRWRWHVIRGTVCFAECSADSWTHRETVEKYWRFDRARRAAATLNRCDPLAKTS